MRINEERNRQPNYVIKVNDLVDHYIATELATGETRHSSATRIICRVFLIRWIKPYWDTFNLTAVRTIAVEAWLKELRRRDGTKIRNVMSLKWKDIEPAYLFLDADCEW